MADREPETLWELARDAKTKEGKTFWRMEFLGSIMDGCIGCATIIATAITIYTIYLLFSTLAG